jgi:O-succinylbenzoate synthase
MKIADVRLFQYRLALAKPLVMKSGRITEREGLVVHLTDADGYVGWGEIAPLPGFSAETIDEARDSAISALRTIMSHDLPDPENLLELGIGAYLNVKLPPSVVYGIESAAMNLWAHSRGVDLRHLIDQSALDSVLVNGLLAGSKEEVIEGVQQMISFGYQSLKLKVGSKSVAKEIDKVKSVRTIIPPHTKLRLDANQAWGFDTAVLFGKSVSHLDIEYIEEPLADSRRLEQFHEKTGLVYALDESLSGVSPESLVAAKGLGAIILKPTILGGLVVTWRFARRAKELGLMPIISSSFESSLGLVALANLAAAVAPTIACGLDTSSWFVDDVLINPLRTAYGKLHLADYSIDRTAIRTELLTGIPVV